MIYKITVKSEPRNFGHRMRVHGLSDPGESGDYTKLLRQYDYDKSLPPFWSVGIAETRAFTLPYAVYLEVYDLVQWHDDIHNGDVFLFQHDGALYEIPVEDAWPRCPQATELERAERERIGYMKNPSSDDDLIAQFQQWMTDALLDGRALGESVEIVRWLPPRDGDPRCVVEASPYVLKRVVSKLKRRIPWATVRAFGASEAREVTFDRDAVLAFMRDNMPQENPSDPRPRCQGCGSVLLEDEVPESVTSGVCLLCATDFLREDIREAERDGGYDPEWLAAARAELGRLYGLRRARS